jgi:hypothetical protein
MLSYYYFLSPNWPGWVSQMLFKTGLRLDRVKLEVRGFYFILFLSFLFQ